MPDLNNLILDAYDAFESKNYQESTSLIETAVRHIKKNEFTPKISKSDKTIILVSLYNLKGFNFMADNELSKAKEAFETALEINPESSQACAGLGEILYLQNMDNESKIMFEWANDLNPENKFAEAGLAKVNKSLGLKETHNTLLVENSIKEKDKMYTSLTDAYKFFAQKKNKESLKQLNKVEKIVQKTIQSNDSSQKLSSIENFKGFNYLALQKFEKAKSCFERALEMNPESSQASAGLAELFYINERDQEAKQMFEWALKYNPENQFAMQGLEKVSKSLEQSIAS